MSKFFVKVTNWLAMLDMGRQKVPIKWSTRSTAHPSRKRYNVHHGSAIGGIITIFYVLTLTMISLSRIKSAMHGDYDSVATYTRKIDFENESDQKDLLD